jgi:hypothetical protein
MLKQAPSVPLILAGLQKEHPWKDVRSKPQESGTIIDNTNDVSAECGASSTTSKASGLFVIEH